MKKYNSKNKDFIIQYFESHKDETLSASEIYQAMIENEMNVNLATVYRNLDKLNSEGHLLKYKTNREESTTYQWNKRNCESHLHLQCKKCGKIIHLDCGFMNEFSKHCFNEHGFVIDCRDSMIQGLCSECRKERDYV